MAGEARPFEEKQEKQSILVDMQGHCESLTALSHNLTESVSGLDDKLELGQLWSEIETLAEQVKKIKGHIEKIRDNP